MKKVGIITYHHHYNYGTALQAFALQKAISMLDGYDAEIIDYRFENERRLSRTQLILLRIRRAGVYVKEWKRISRLMKYADVLNAKNCSFNKFFKNELKTSQDVFPLYSDLVKSAPKYDIYVTGSDQTWSPKIGFNPAMFLEFASAKGYKIAYAPSIGVANLSKTEADYLNVHLQPYDAISCRETIGREALQKVVKGKTITCVLDPTLLLNSEDWNNLAVAPQIKQPYILCYFIGDRPYYRIIAKQLSIDLDLPLFFIPVSWQDVGEGNNLISEAGPKEFLGLFRDARLVLTDSFHGTAFSINYHKSFYSFTKIEGGKKAMDNSRLYDILSKVHLEDRLIDNPAKIVFTDIDYSEVDKILSKEREISWEFLKNALIDRNICGKTECTGCEACLAVCSHCAISIETDLMGFHYPKKNLSKCVECGLCTSVCPNNISPVFNKPHNAYIAAAIKSDEQKSSTSGGLASVLARATILKGGVVYGCSAADRTHVKHIRVTTESELLLLKGSKYVQSDISGIMPQIRQDLKNGSEVLFVGTPCQVAGLRQFLRKQYTNLTTVDFICHGVPSQQLLNDIVTKDSALDLSNKQQIQFRFKDGDAGSKYGVRIKDKDGKVLYTETWPESRYAAGFLAGMYYRESCYQCHYARQERVSDITLGDWWDRNKEYTHLPNYKGGLSLVMLNTQKGKDSFSDISDLIVSAPASVDNLVSQNGQLAHPMSRNVDYELFRNIYMNDGYTENATAVLDKEIERVKKNIKLSNLSAKLKKTAAGRWAISAIKSIRK